ncbi:alpha/beta fold hydrolase [Rhizobium panacihumi]|uniref:alpha/beta fold hydrolase n=1 Tax=Rhizobium panacihumi TaxID=2008450 RepID=UPI003D794F2B
MALLLIPGFMLDADLWRGIEPALAQWGEVTHAVASEGDTLAEMAQAILKNAPPRFVLVGFSMGGYVAREILRQDPQRVEALILIATSARGDSEIQAKRKQALTEQPDGIAFRGLSTTAVASSLHPDNAGRSDLITRIQEMGQRLGGDVFRRQSLLDRRDEREELDAIRCPTLVIAGGEDRLRSREEALELHEGIAGSAFVVIEKTGHMVPMEAPERLAEVMNEWLAGCSDRQA